MTVVGQHSEYATLSEQKTEKEKEEIGKEKERRRVVEMTIREAQGKKRESTVARCIEMGRLHRAHRVSRI